MKQLIAKLVCIILAVTMIPLGALAEGDGAGTYALEGKTYPHLRAFTDEEQPMESEITLYFVNGGDIPYISLADFMALLADVEKGRAEWDAAYDVQAGANQMFIVTRPDNGSRMIVDGGKDTIIFTDFDLFTSMPGGSSLVSVLDLPKTERLTVSEKLDLVMKRIEGGEPMSRALAAFPNDEMRWDCE